MYHYTPITLDKVKHWRGMHSGIFVRHFYILALVSHQNTVGIYRNLDHYKAPQPNTVLYSCLAGLWAQYNGLSFHRKMYICVSHRLDLDPWVENQGLRSSQFYVKIEVLFITGVCFWAADVNSCKLPVLLKDIRELKYNTSQSEAHTSELLQFSG